MKRYDGKCSESKGRKVKWSKQKHNDAQIKTLPNDTRKRI